MQAILNGFRGHREREGQTGGKVAERNRRESERHRVRDMDLRRNSNVGDRGLTGGNWELLVLIKHIYRCINIE